MQIRGCPETTSPCIPLIGASPPSLPCPSRHLLTFKFSASLLTPQLFPTHHTLLFSHFTPPCLFTTVHIISLFTTLLHCKNGYSTDSVLVFIKRYYRFLTIHITYTIYTLMRITFILTRGSNPFITL